MGRTGDGYRYDHTFVVADLADQVTACEYVHEPRTLRLTDHSALSLRLSVPLAEPLLVSDPTAIEPVHTTLFSLCQYRRSNRRAARSGRATPAGTRSNLVHG